MAIDKAVKAEDRAAALQKPLDAELAQPQPSSRKATELAGEIHQLEALVVRLVRKLDAVSVPQKSVRHQEAVRTRWDSRSHRQKVV